MTQPLDFSSVGRKPAAQPLQKPSGRRKGGGGPTRLLLLTAIVAGAAFLAVVVFDVFGDDGRGMPPGSARYCELAGELGRVSLETGAASAPGVYDGPSEKIKVAVDQMGNTLKELRSVAPALVRDDVASVNNALARAAAGDVSAVKDPSFAATALRTSRYSLSSCSRGNGSEGD